MLRGVGTLALAGFLLGIAACGPGGDGDGPPLVSPHVVAFSPSVVPYDFTDGSQAPRYTDGSLTVNTDPSHPGHIGIFFDALVPIVPSSFYVGGDPYLGLDLDALRVLMAVPGSGLVPLPVEAEFAAHHILLTPVTMPLAPGQYTIVVGTGGRGTNGFPVAPAPVYHTFFVDSDPLGPYVMKTVPAPDEFTPATNRDVLVHFTEGIDGTSVEASSIQAVHLGALQATPIATAVGYPRMQTEIDGSTLPSNGHVLVWRARDPLPTSGSIEVTVSGAGAPGLRDLNGIPLAAPYTFRFRVSP